LFECGSCLCQSFSGEILLELTGSGDDIGHQPSAGGTAKVRISHDVQGNFMLFKCLQKYLKMQ